MAQLDLKPHKYEMRKGEPVLARITPYCRLAKRVEQGVVEEVFIQGGKFFSGENSPEIKKADLPDWFAEEVAKLNPEVRREVGLKD